MILRFDWLQRTLYPIHVSDWLTGFPALIRVVGASLKSSSIINSGKSLSCLVLLFDCASVPG